MELTDKDQKLYKEKLIEIIQSYTYYCARLYEVQKQLEKMSYKVTPTYGNESFGACSGNQNKLEDYSIKQYELHQKEKHFKSKIIYVKRLIEKSDLTETEKNIMWWIANNGKLAAYARKNHIGKDNVYKIRDKAVKKILSKNKMCD